MVTILDDGIQHNHPDLRDNYDHLASTDINGNDNDPMPQDNGSVHCRIIIQISKQRISCLLIMRQLLLYFISEITNMERDVQVK